MSEFEKWYKENNPLSDLQILDWRLRKKMQKKAWQEARKGYVRLNDVLQILSDGAEQALKQQIYFLNKINKIGAPEEK